MESAMCSALYTGLGQSVTYTAQNATAATIYAIVDDGVEYVGADVQAAERITSARVKASDITMPRRGDRLTLAAGTAYLVDDVARENNTEWRLLLTERDR